MRTIKFRGISLETDDWVYGYLADGNLICTWDNIRNAHEVLSTTVGQFTGLYDKHGREIYEGDILREPPKKEYDKENYVAYEVFWHDNDCASHHIGWQMNRCHFQGCICGTMYIPEFLPKTTARMEIVGNIHDNKNLLVKGGEQ